MTKIALSIKNTKSFTVEARVTGKGKAGNVRVQPLGKIWWKGTGQASSYTVTFVDLDTDAAIWPFGDSPPKSGTTAAGAPYLKVTTTEVETTLSQNAPEDIKYEVVAVEPEDNKDVAPLDPMIVVRPAQTLGAQSSNGIMLGVVSAVLGAAAGALALLWMQS